MRSTNLIVIAVMLLMFSCKTIEQKRTLSVKHAEININPEESLGKESFTDFKLKLYNMVLEGKIKAYQNDSFTGMMSPEQVGLKGGAEEIIKICPDPDNPNDCYDSVVVVPFNPEDILRLKFAFDFVFNTNNNTQKLVFKGIAPTFKWKIAGIELPESAFFYVHKDDLLREFGEETLKEILAQAYELIIREYDIYKRKDADLSSFFLSCLKIEELFLMFKEVYYESITSGFEGEIYPAYQDDNLTTIMKPEEVALRGSTEDIVEICPDLDWPDDCYDSTIVTPFNLYYADGILFSVNWSKDLKKMEFYPEVSAFSLAAIERKNGKITPIGWVPWSKLTSLLDIMEVNMLSYAFYMHQIENGWAGYNFVPRKNEYLHTNVNEAGEVYINWE